MNLLNLLMMGGTGPQSKGSPYSSIIFLVLIIAVFYFFMIRPQSKRAKEERKFREGLQKGDRVITAGGIHGKIVEVQDTAVIIEVLDQTRLKVEKSSLTKHANAGSGAEEKK